MGTGGVGTSKDESGKRILEGTVSHGAPLCELLRMWKGEYPAVLTAGITPRKRDLPAEGGEKKQPLKRLLVGIDGKGRRTKMKQEKGTVPVSALVPAHSRRKSRRRKEFSAFAQLQFTVPVLYPWCQVPVPEMRIPIENRAFYRRHVSVPRGFSVPLRKIKSV